MTEEEFKVLGDGDRVNSPSNDPYIVCGSTLHLMARSADFWSLSEINSEEWQLISKAMVLIKREAKDKAKAKRPERYVHKERKNAQDWTVLDALATVSAQLDYIIRQTL